MRGECFQSNAETHNMKTVDNLEKQQFRFMPFESFHNVASTMHVQEIERLFIIYSRFFVYSANKHVC